MKKIISIFSTVALVVAVSSCGEEPTEEQVQEEVVVEEEKKAEAPVKTLQLNNGEKWEANPETTEGIAKMKAIVMEEVEEGRLSHYAAMGERLNIELKAIFSSCTMKGESHEQLHLYIMPLVDLCEQLEYVEDENTALFLQKDILKRVNLYEEYFQ